MVSKSQNIKSKILKLNPKLLFGVWCLLCISSSSSFTFISSYDTKATMVEVDNFSNFYTAGGTQLFEYSPDGAFMYPYEENKYGKIGMIDVTNPLKILVFYPDFMVAVTLDKFLSHLSTYSFLKLGYQDITAVASSSDGLLWFYDNVEFKLKKIDENGNIILASQPLNTFLDQTPNPNFITEKESKVYLNDPDIGILVFDVFGSYAKTIPIKGLTKFQVLGDQVIYFDNHHQLSAYSQFTLDVKSVPLPDSTDIVNVAITKDRMAILKKDKVGFYKY